MLILLKINLKLNFNCIFDINVNRFLAIITFILLYGCLVAQTPRLCSTDTYHQNNTSNLSNQKINLPGESISLSLNNVILANDRICLPLVINNVYKNEDQKISIEAVEAQIEQLNEDFNTKDEIDGLPPYFQELVATVGIEFYLLNGEADQKNSINYFKTEVDTFNMNSYPNIKKSNEGGFSSSNTKNHINIWVGNLEAGIKGYATLPGVKSKNIDGIVLHYKNFGSSKKTFTHEMGHFLGLYHLFGNEEGSCEEDDNIKDTPQTATAYKTCSTENLVANQCNDPYFEYDLTQNFMNLCNDVKMFTKGQKIKMLYNLLTHKKSLLVNNCAVLPGNELDVSLTNLNTLPIICNSELILNYEICNVGKTDISNFNFELKGILTEDVEIQIIPGQCVEYKQAFDISTYRLNSVTALIKNVNQSNKEQNLENNIAEFNFRKANMLSLPYEENFATSTGWLKSNTDDAYNWTYVADSANVKNACYVFKPHPLNDLSIGSLFSPVFDLNNNFTLSEEQATTFTVTFDIAYSKASDNIILDDLFLEYNNVCEDSTYQQLTKLDLSDVTTNLTADQLLNSQENTSWSKFIYDFETSAETNNLNFKLTYISSSTNMLLIDNFKISANESSQAPLNIQTYIEQNKAGFYPNPVSNGIVHFYSERYKGNYATVNLYDQYGKLQKIFLVKNYQKLDVSNLPNGQYYATFNWNNKIVTKKLFLLK